MEYRKAGRPEDRVKPQSGSISLVTDSELGLALRRPLEEIFRSLDLVHDEIEVTSGAARAEGQPEIANVLIYSVANRLFGEMKSLTNIIERLGGRTDLSEM